MPFEVRYCPLFSQASSELPHPVNKSPSVPTKSTGFPSDMCSSCPQTGELMWILDLVAQNYLGRHGFLHNHNVNWQSPFNRMAHCFYALSSNSRGAHRYFASSYSGTLIPRGRGVTLCFPGVLWVLILWWRVRGCWQESQSAEAEREPCTWECVQAWARSADGGREVNAWGPGPQLLAPLTFG